MGGFEGELIHLKRRSGCAAWVVDAVPQIFPGFAERRFERALIAACVVARLVVHHEPREGLLLNVIQVVADLGVDDRPR